MSTRSRKHRKRFSCGHRGFGQFCHCCADQARISQQLTALKLADQVQRRVERQRWQESFALDRVDLTRLPKRIVLSARDILKQLEQGAGFWTLSGKRLSPDRTLVRIPLREHYRLVGRWIDNRFIPLDVSSHETYNRVVSKGFKGRYSA